VPRGPAHADLCRDDEMFVEERLTGFFDFYFAGCATWIFEVAADDAAGRRTAFLAVAPGRLLPAARSHEF